MFKGVLLVSWPLTFEQHDKKLKMSQIIGSEAEQHFHL